MNVPKSVVLLSGPEDDGYCGEPAMKFRLTYAGELRPTQRDPEEVQADPLAAHKHSIRREFHRQLRHLWNTDPFLSTHSVHPTKRREPRSVAKNVSYYSSATDTGFIPMVDDIANRWNKFNYRFVPLVRDELSLLCSLDILFLRRDAPGSGIISAGDIDNRIKTLIDTLRAPRSPNELVEEDQTPEPDDDPMFCLLEDDSQVTRLSVEGDVLLDPPTNDEADQRRVKLVITVELRPYYVP